MTPTGPHPVRVGVIGCGYWGPNLVRNFARDDRAEVLAVCDMRIERAGRVAREYGVEIATSNPRVVMDHRGIDLVVVATPTRTHYQVAKAAIEAGKHVLVMKPMCDSVERAEELVDLARRRGVLLAVDHTFLFTGAVRKMRDLVTAGDLGDLYYIDSVRINLGLFQSDVNVIWDLAPHDISIIDYLIGGVLPEEVSATAAAHAGSQRENVAYVTLRYGNNVLAHVHVNWLAPAKVRRMIVGGSKRMIIYDDVQPSEKLMVYDKGVTIGPTPYNLPGHNGMHTNGTSSDVASGSDPALPARSSQRRRSRNGDAADDLYSQLVSYRSGDMFAPRLDDREALAVEVDHLIGCLRNGTTPISDGDSGLRVVRILDAAQRSVIRGRGSVTLPDRRTLSNGRETPVKVEGPVDPRVPVLIDGDPLVGLSVSPVSLLGS